MSCLKSLLAAISSNGENGRRVGLKNRFQFWSVGSNPSWSIKMARRKIATLENVLICPSIYQSFKLKNLLLREGIKQPYAY